MTASVRTLLLLARKWTGFDGAADKASSLTGRAKVLALSPLFELDEVTRTFSLKITPRPYQRRVFLRASLQGLAAMMAGCGYDQRGRTVPGATQDRVDPEKSGGGPSHSEGDGDDPMQGQAGMGGSFPEGLPALGQLGPPNKDGVRVPPGYSARIIAVSGEEVAGGDGYIWHDYPDGAATVPTPTGGWLYISNSEVSAGGGVGVLELDRHGKIISAYSICKGSRMNCQGGLTPAQTFLTCEEVAMGVVIECFPRGGKASVERRALGVFRHEGLAYDQSTHQIYMTEDEYDGRFYRFTPDKVLASGTANLSAGKLEVARVLEDGSVEWLKVPDPKYEGGVSTRLQVPESTAFVGGEGIWWQDSMVYFTTKGDNRVWQYDIKKQKVGILYDANTADSPLLTGVDAIVGTTGGELLVAEDQGNMQVVVILPTGELKALVQVDGQPNSEITGIAFNPSGTHFYFSSQRGNGRGITYELVGPFGV